MIDTEKLRSRILSLAMKGELSERSAQDGLASDLYAQIIETKSKLVKSGNIRKDKKYEKIEDDNMPYQIPDNWCWVRFGKIINLQSGQDLKPSEYNDHENGIPYITGASNYGDDGSIIINRWTDYPKAYAYKNDILLSCKGTVGKLIVLQEKEVHIARQIMGIRTYDVDVDFIFYYLQSMIYGIKEAQKGLIPGIERNDVLDLLCPLPPLPEQKRIVKKIEALFYELCQIDRLQNQYTSNQEALKGKLIEAAIQGKLTEQLPEDGTADALYHSILEEKQLLIKAGKLKKEKSLPEIVEDEIPFEIPENWRWVRISDVIDVRDGTHDSPKYHDEGIPLVTSKNISSGKLIFDDVKLISMDDAQKINERSYVDDGDILFAMIGSIGNPVIVHKDREFCIKNVALFKNFAPMHISMDYFYWFLMHEQFVLRKNAIGGLQSFVSLKVFRSHLMPLPPMSEQIRIAERLYELEDVVLEQEK